MNAYHSAVYYVCVFGKKLRSIDTTGTNVLPATPRKKAGAMLGHTHSVNARASRHVQSPRREENDENERPKNE